MTPEGIVSAAPEVILTTEKSIERLGGWDAFLEHPGIAHTPAAENDRVVAMEDLYLMGFGPRTGQAIADLAVLLYPVLLPDPRRGRGSPFFFPFHILFHILFLIQARSPSRPRRWWPSSSA